MSLLTNQGDISGARTSGDAASRARALLGSLREQREFFEARIRHNSVGKRPRAQCCFGQPTVTEQHGFDESSITDGIQSHIRTSIQERRDRVARLLELSVKQSPILLQCHRSSSPSSHTVKSHETHVTQESTQDESITGSTSKQQEPEEEESKLDLGTLDLPSFTVTVRKEVDEKSDHSISTCSLDQRQYDEAICTGKSSTDTRLSYPEEVSCNQSSNGTSITESQAETTANAASGTQQNTNLNDGELNYLKKKSHLESTRVRKIRFSVAERIRSIQYKWQNEVTEMELQSNNRRGEIGTIESTSPAELRQTSQFAEIDISTIHVSENDAQRPSANECCAKSPIVDSVLFDASNSKRESKERCLSWDKIRSPICGENQENNNSASCMGDSKCDERMHSFREVREPNHCIAACEKQSQELFPSDLLLSVSRCSSSSFDSDDSFRAPKLIEAELPCQLSALTRSSGTLMIPSIDSLPTPLGTADKRTVYIEKLYPRTSQKIIAKVRKARVPRTNSRDLKTVGKLMVVPENDNSEDDESNGESFIGVTYLSSPPRSLSPSRQGTDTNPLPMSPINIMIASDDSSNDYTTDSNTSGWVSEDNYPNNSLLGSDDEDEEFCTDLDAIVEPMWSAQLQALIQNENQRIERVQAQSETLSPIELSPRRDETILVETKTSPVRHAASVNMPLHTASPKWIKSPVGNGHQSEDASDSSRPRKRKRRFGSASLTARRGVSLAGQNLFAQPITPEVARIWRGPRPKVLQLKPLLWIPEEMADSLCQWQGGWYAMAIATGMTRTSPVSTKTLLPGKESHVFAALSSDFRCGTSGSLYTIAVQSGCKISEPLSDVAPLKSLTRKTRKRTVPAQGGLYNLACRSGYSREETCGRREVTVTVKMATVFEKSPSYDTSDENCACRGGSYYLAVGGYDPIPSLS